jgi:hypothetical protein
MPVARFEKVRAPGVGLLDYWPSGARSITIRPALEIMRFPWSITLWLIFFGNRERLREASQRALPGGGDRG